jgi:hypothetical protein
MRSATRSSQLQAAENKFLASQSRVEVPVLQDPLPKKTSDLNQVRVLLSANVRAIQPRQALCLVWVNELMETGLV